MMPLRQWLLRNALQHDQHHHSEIALMRNLLGFIIFGLVPRLRAPDFLTTVHAQHMLVRHDPPPRLFSQQSLRRTLRQFDRIRACTKLSRDSVDIVDDIHKTMHYFTRMKEGRFSPLYFFYGFSELPWLFPTNSGCVSLCKTIAFLMALYESGRGSVVRAYNDPDSNQPILVLSVNNTILAATNTWTGGVRIAIHKANESHCDFPGTRVDKKLMTAMRQDTRRPITPQYTQEYDWRDFRKEDAINSAVIDLENLVQILA